MQNNDMNEKTSGYTANCEQEKQIKPWENWAGIPVGHEQVMMTMAAVQKKAEGFYKELVAVKREWNAAKNDNQQKYEAAKSRIIQQFEDEKGRLNKECEKNVSMTKAKKLGAKRIVDACDDFISSIPKYEKKMLHAAVTGMTEVAKKESVYISAIDEKIQVYQELYKHQIAEVERIRNESLGKAKEDYAEAMERTKKRFEAKYDSVRDSHRELVRVGFNKETIRAYRDKIKSASLNAEHYECCTEVPEYVTLGELCYILPNSSQEEQEVIQALDLQTSEIGTKTKDGYGIRLPYSQRLSDGISLLM